MTGRGRVGWMTKHGERAGCEDKVNERGRVACVRQGEGGCLTEMGLDARAVSEEQPEQSVGGQHRVDRQGCCCSCHCCRRCCRCCGRCLLPRAFISSLHPSSRVLSRFHFPLWKALCRSGSAI
eukprot:3811283-Rhodomonas_salina.6